MKSSIAAGFLLFTGVLPLHAAVSLTASTTAPAVGVNDQSSLDATATIPGGTFNSQAFSDNAGPPGQTFTTGAGAGYVLTAFSYKGAAQGGGNYGGFVLGTTWSIRISSVSGTTVNPLATVSAIAHPAGTLLGDEWFTFTFTGADALALSPSTTYAFEAASSAGYLGFDASGVNTAYAGGTAFNSASTARTFSSTAMNIRDYDRTFVANLAVVPEPASLALVVMGASLCARRRRV